MAVRACAERAARTVAERMSARAEIMEIFEGPDVHTSG